MNNLHIEELIEYLNVCYKHLKIKLKNIYQVEDNLYNFTLELKINNKIKFILNFDYDKRSMFNSNDIHYFRSLIDSKILKEI